MQGLHRGVIIAVLMAWSITSFAGPQVPRAAYGFFEQTPPDKIVIAERSLKSISVYDSSGRISSLHKISAPGASFIKLHFSQFRLPEGVQVEISNPDRSEVWNYSADKKDAFTVDTSLGDDGKKRFSAMSITGDYAQLRLLGNLSALDPFHHMVQVDSILEGLPLGQSKKNDSKIDLYADDGISRTQSLCGANELYDAACWAGSNNWEYERSAAVAKIITSGGEVCTAWRVGQNNMMFTAEHCLSSQSELSGSEIWFNYESTSCGSSQTTNAVKVSGGNLLSTDATLDYALFSVSNFSAISSFPSFGLDVGSVSAGEPIFIPQHGWGDPRQISIESDMNSSGECEVDDPDMDGYASGSDLGYYCDTTSSSSGAPVVSNVSGDVVALHHLGGCMNSGVKMSKIWNRVSSHFGGQVPSGDSGGSSGGGGNQEPSADFSYNCNDFNCSFDGSSSSDPDGSIDEYSWDISDGSSGTGSSFDHEFSETGDYSVTLTVEDNDGASAELVQTVNVAVQNEDPRANFSMACVDNQCEFNGNSSEDPDGEIVAWNWNFGDGSTDYGANASHTYAQAGTFNIGLSVEDDKGAIDFKYRTVSLSMPNETPVASFGFSCTELECNFNGDSSSDPDGDITAWDWDFGDGNSASGSQVSHSYTGSGNYSVTVSVTDDDGSASSTSQQVSVTAPEANQAPVASFSFSCTNLICDFSAVSSTDPDGQVTAWNWNFGDGSSGSGSQAGHIYDSGGNYSVTVSVTDNDGSTSSTSQQIAVTAPPVNEAPVANFSFSCNELDCSFNAGSSTDPDGQITAWDWNFGDGSNANGSQASHRYSSNGNYSVTVIVTDNDGSISSTSRQVSVTSVPVNQEPNANFSFSCNELDCNFDAGSSSDPDGQITTRNWSFGDGSSASGSQVSHRFSVAGSFSVSLTVSDNAGATDSLSRSVAVSASGEQPNNAPEADFDFSCTYTECEFDGTASNDPDGTPASWTWSFGDGSNATGERTVHEFGSPGTYTATLTVEDGDGATDTHTQTISVNAPSSNQAPESRFSYECDELTCQFDASQSYDPDGNLVSYTWSMGDGGSATDMKVVHRYPESGNFRVALTVVDNEGESHTNTSPVRVETSLPEISLRGEGIRQNGRTMATLRWSGAESANVELFRNGRLFATTANDGKHIDMEVEGRSKSASYRLCEPSSQTCSPTVILRYGSEPGG